MRYAPKVLSEKFSEDCTRTGRHYWRPIADISTAPNTWRWTCVACRTTVDTRPPDAITPINLRDLERMVDSSLRLADGVVIDDQSLKGDLWLMRHAEWVYHPYRIKIVYHIYHGEPFVVLFRYTAQLDSLKPRWNNIIDTDSYRRLLEAADVQRIHHTGLVKV